MESIEYYQQLIKGKLSPRRYEHSCAVSAEAVRLAEKYGADAEKARFAGLVHDIEKDASASEQLQIMEKYSIILDDVEKYSRKLWHAITGAAVLANEYGVDDPEIIAAVRYHTTGRAGMSTLEKVIYLADYISADRSYEGVDELREAVDVSLDSGLRAAYDFSINELVIKGAALHLDTVRARNEMICQNAANDTAAR
jgi:predicted HD superfamily hydrolase involved in NAD metabolism